MLNSIKAGYFGHILTNEHFFVVPIRKRISLGDAVQVKGELIVLSPPFQKYQEADYYCLSNEVPSSGVGKARSV